MIENKLFIIGKKESEKIVIDDNIFNDLEINNYLEDDVEGNLYNPLEFKINIKKIYKKYSKENLMKEICKYY